MSELQHANWSETAASNNAAAPDGAPEGMLGSALNNTIRENMAAIKRDWNRSHVTISSTGSANAYVLTYSNAPTLTHGMIFSFKANFANTATATANVNALGAITITRSDGATALLAGDILANQHVVLSYDSALSRMVMLSPPSSLASDSEGAAVASAATTNIWADAGGTLHITGTTTITSFGTAPYAGAWKKVIFDGALTLTHGANLSLPGSANITTAADDMAFVYADTTTQFDVLYFKKNGAQVVGGLALLQTVTASGATTVDLDTGFGAAYDDYVIIASGIRPSTTSLLACRLKIAGAYVTANYVFHSNLSNSSASTYTGSGSSSNAYIVLSEDLNQIQPDSNLSFTMQVYDANSSLAKQVAWIGSSFDSNVNRVGTAAGAGTNTTPGVLTGVRFLPASGTISGTFKLYGVGQ